MRPSDITDGNCTGGMVAEGRSRFNEAVGYYRRKHPALAPYCASMRPSDITDGNARGVRPHGEAVGSEEYLA